MEGKLLNDNLCFILERLAQNRELYKLLYPESPVFSEDLIHKNILTVGKLPADRKGSFIVVHLIELNPNQNGIQTLLLRIDVICGLGDGEWITNGKIRCFLIIDEIIKELENVNISGIGKLTLDSISEIDVSREEYGGYALGYYCSTLEETSK